MFIRPGTNLNNISGVIWDFDGVFYPNNFMPDKGFDNLCDLTKAEVVCTLLPDLPFGEALELARRSYDTYGDAVTGFLPLAKERGLEDSFKTDVFHNYHASLLTTVTGLRPDFCAVDPEMIHMFSALPDLRHCVASHSCAERWLRPLLSRLEVAPFMSHVFGFAEFGFESKSLTPKAVEMAAEALGLPASKLLFVEDSKANLKVAKARFPDLTTALLTDVPMISAPEDYIDIVMPQPLGVLSAIAESRKPAPAAAVAPALTPRPF